ITLVGVIAAATGGASVADSFEPVVQKYLNISSFAAEIISLVCLAVPLSCLLIIFAELVPKVYALNNEERVCLALSPWVKRLFHIVSPIISVFEMIVKFILGLSGKSAQNNHMDFKTGLHELKAAVSLARTSKLINAQEEKIVLSAASLSSRYIKDIMIPLNDIFMIPESISFTEALVKAHCDMHTRFPVCTVENDHQTIKGYVTFKDIVNALKMNQKDPTIRGIIRLIKAFYSNETISSVLEKMIHEKHHIALIKSPESNLVIGMVTLEDIIEELVGDIEDEADRLPNNIYPYGDKWLMGGGVSMKKVTETMGISNADINLDINLAEWTEKKFGGQIGGGEVIDAEGINIVVRKIKRRKLSEAIVGRISE
ncbi:MAG: protein of unknown function DUF21, partial [uncultured bacterium]